jgi:hypothetical protein
MINRRQFLQTSAGAAALLTLRTSRAYAFAQSPGLAKFPAGWAAPGLGAIPFTTGIADSLFPGAKLVDLVAGQYTQQLHPALPKATSLWGYAEATTGNFNTSGRLSLQRGTCPSACA